MFTARHHPAFQAAHRGHHWVVFVLLLTTIVGLMLSGDGSLNMAAFVSAFGTSLVSVAVAYIVALAFSLVLGLAVVVWPALGRAVLPLLDIGQSLPVFAILPLLLALIGQTPVAVILLLVFVMVWPMTLNLLIGASRLSRDTIDAARVYGMTGRSRLLGVVWPAVRPQVLSGSMTAWTLAWQTIIGAEIISGATGAGHYLATLGVNGNLRLLTLGILVFTFLLFAINQLVWLPLLHRYSHGGVR